MSNQTLVGPVIAGLLTVWRADATLTGYGDRLRIYDGPPTIDRAAEIELWVAATGVQPEEEVIRFAQDRADYDGDRDEQIEIDNAVWVYATDNLIASARTTALDVFNAAAAAIRSSTLSVTGLFALDVVRGTIRQGQYGTGPGLVLPFTVQATGQV